MQIIYPESSKSGLGANPQAKTMTSIANPLYDAAFKYLMEDNKIAKLIISMILEEEVEELEFRPQEQVFHLTERSLTVYRMDFSAKIKMDHGKSRLVLIEIQKAKFHTDILRFRKYLGKQYQNEENLIQIPRKGQTIKKALPIVSIYFLGFPLEHSKAPFLICKRRYLDGTTKEEIKEREEFIESLTHDSFIIQIPYLKQKRQNDLLALLSIFDQDQQTKADKKILEFNESDYPEKYRKVIRRLQQAIADPAVRETMDLEDEILADLEQQERRILQQEQVIEEKEQALEEKEQALQNAIRLLINQGMTEQEVKQALKLENS